MELPLVLSLFKDLSSDPDKSSPPESSSFSIPSLLFSNMSQPQGFSLIWTGHTPLA